MADSFDPYHKWLGISPKDQPANHYRLLGIELFEADADVIEGAADQRMSHVRTFQAGQNSALSQRLLNELSAAKLCLLTPQKKADYDRQLRERMAPVDNSLRAPLAAPAQQRAALPIATVLPQAAPRPATPAAPVIIAGNQDLGASTYRPHRKTPLWRQPALLGTAGALVLFGAIAYFLASSGKLPTEATVTKTSTTNTVPAAPPETDDPLALPGGKSNAGAAGAPPTIEPPNTTVAMSRPDFEIIEATWGAGEKWVNVTDALRKRVKNHRLMMIVWSNLFGSPEDPAPGVGKKLRIQYRSRGKNYNVEYWDLWFVYLDGNPLRPPTDSPDDLELLEALYGAGDAFVDVLPQLRQRMRDGRLAVAADEFAEATADELAKLGINANIFKVLWVRYRNGTGEHFIYAWNNRLLSIESRLPKKSSSPVDLLKLTEVPRDAIFGNWSMKDGQLLAPAEVAARVQIPFDVPDDYALNVVVESEGPLQNVSAGLVVGGHHALATIDAASNYSGMALINGVWHGDDKNPTKTWRKASMLEQGRPNLLTYIVRPTGVRMLRDGAEILRWSGDPRTFSLPKSWEVPDPRRLYLQSYNVPYRITKVELTPLAPEKSPMLVVGESGGPVDVLAAIDLDRDRLHGDWQYDGQTLISPGNEHGVMEVQLPAIVPADYQLDAIAQRESGNDCLSFTFPVAGTYGTLNIDGKSGTVSGLQMIDGKDFMSNESTREAQVFADGKTHSINIRVEKNHVRLFCDGKPLVDWAGDVSRLKSSEEPPYRDRIYVGHWHSRYRLTKIKIRPLNSETPEDTPPGLAGAPIDLLKKVDVAKDAVEGDWKRTDEAIVSPAKSGARLMLPFEPSGDYELTVVAERRAGSDSFVLGLVIGGRQVAMTLDGYGGETAGLADVDGHDGATNETTRRGRLLPPGKPHNIVCAVSSDKLSVTCDGKKVITWSGDTSRLSNSVFWTVPNERRLFLGAWESEFKYTRIEVQPMPTAALAASERKGASAQMNPAAPSNVEPPRRRFSDLSSNGGGEKRAVVPDDESLKKARQEMQKNFSSSMKSARTPDLKRSLSQEMAEKASLEEKGSAYAYVLFNQAIDLAEATGDLDLAWKIIDQLAGSFDVDGMDLRNRSLVGAGKAARTPERAWELADAACRLMLAALKEGDAAAVQKAGKQAEIFAKRTKDKSVQKLVAAHADDAATLAGEIGAVEEARETLKTMPLDAHANQVVGHYELCATGNWNSALPKLARSDDAEWRKLAQSEQSLGDLADPARQLSTADGWWSLAEGAPWPGKHYLQMRAGKRYAAAHRSLVDVGRVRAADRIKTLLALDDGLPNWELFNWRGFQANQPIGEIARVENGRSLETAVEYDGAIDVILVARATGTKIRLHSHNWSWNWDFVVEPNRWHTLRYTITPYLRTAMLDGLLVHTDGSKTARRLNPAPVYISAFNDEIIEVKKFVVRGL